MNPEYTPEDILTLINKLNKEQQVELFQKLKESLHSLHKLEILWNINHELILDAILRSADITQRGVRGVIAEAVFKYKIIDNLKEWKDITPEGQNPFDFLLKDKESEVKIQVKLQRMEKGKPVITTAKTKRFISDMFIVETQKTRSGKDKAGEKTRPYRFGEFDILAVNLHPSTGDWNSFAFTISRWLIPSLENTEWMNTFQPIPGSRNDDWTNDFNEAVSWFRSNIKKKIKGERE